jgi:outer membrane protein
MHKNYVAQALSLALVALAWPASAFAQFQDAVTEGAGETAVASDQDHIILGVGAAAVPVFQGAKDYRVLPVPAIDIKQGWLFANLRNGIGVAPIQTNHVTIGASVVYLQGYRHKDVPDGVNKLSNGAGARVFADFRAAGFVATLGVTKGFAGQAKGVLADATIGYPVMISDRFTLVPTVGTTWANARYNNRYFGIDAREAAASGLSQFSAGSGFKDLTASLTARYRLTDRIGVNLTGGVVTLLGDAKDSPLVQYKTRPTALVSFSYRLR